MLEKKLRKVDYVKWFGKLKRNNHFYNR